MNRTSTRATLMALTLALLLAALGTQAQDERPGRGERRRPGGQQAALTLPDDVAALDRLSLVLGRPTATSVSASLLAREGCDAYIEYGSRPGDYSWRTPTLTLQGGTPTQAHLDRLPPDSRIHYRLRHRPSGSATFLPGAERSFHTQRAPGRSFVFEVQGDSHPERRHQFDAELYARTLRGAAADQPDFYLLLGDDFSVDTLHERTRDSVTRRYALQRPFLALVGQSAALFLANGNHEQAALANLDGSQDNVAVWAQNAREAYFPQPAPDGFYTGNPEPVEHIGLLRNYFAWVWGDAQFIVIDPYWHSQQPVDTVLGGGRKNRDLWAVTLGETQYRWFKETLEKSRARLKFVFTHHVLGTGRGGIEMARLQEWGGHERNGRNTFAEHRPGWPLPIHDLMAKYGVTVFFQGHDHVFARQELDGVIYQTLPLPADPNGTLHNAQAFRSGDVLPGPGRLRVRVGSDTVRVEYVQPLVQGGSAAPSADKVVFAYEAGARSAPRRDPSALPGGSPR